MKTSKTIQSVVLGSFIAVIFSSAQAMDLTHEHVDLNQDGKVSENEIIAVVKNHFLAMDKDDSHTVSRSEWDEYSPVYTER